MKYFNFYINYVFVASSSPMCIYDLSKERILFLEDFNLNRVSYNEVFVSLNLRKWPEDLISALLDLDLGVIDSEKRIHFPIEPVFKFKLNSIVFYLKNINKKKFLPLRKFKSTRSIIIVVENELSYDQVVELLEICEDNAIPNIEIVIQSNELELALSSKGLSTNKVFILI